MSDWDRYSSSERSVAGASYETDDQSESSGDIRDRARQGVEQMRSSAEEVGGRARQGFDHYFHRHPLSVGAGVFALGVAVGMMFPSSRQEDRWMGEASERIKERTREAASKVTDVAKSSLKEATETARSEIEERGLDKESLKHSAQEAAHDARDVAEKAAGEARHKAEEEAKRKNLR